MKKYDYPIHNFENRVVYSLVTFCMDHGLMNLDRYNAFVKLDLGEQDITPEDFEALGFKLGDLKGRIKKPLEFQKVVLN
jgi:hypothetical protein